MVAAAAASAFLAVPLNYSAGRAASGGVSSASPIQTNTRPARLQVKAHAQAPPKINGNSVNFTKIPENGDTVQTPPPRTFINQLPDWSVLLAAMTTVFLAAEKQWTMIDWKPKRQDMISDPFGLGRIVRSGLTPRWQDLDVNQHVNNVKYLGWILKSAPQTILESHELGAVTLEYRRECGKESVLQSLTVLAGDDSVDDPEEVEYQHLLRLENGSEILRARTEWRPKNTNK